jgi:hypothetical protein
MAAESLHRLHRQSFGGHKPAATTSVPLPIARKAVYGWHVCNIVWPVRLIGLLPAVPGFSLPLIIAAAAVAQEPPAKAIQDNSFLVEEAYNQEEGIVQHILNAQYFSGNGQSGWNLSFTQEWPFPGQQHQLSYTVPYNFVDTRGRSNNGVGEVILNYRFQALLETDRIPAFAPRLSLVLPTGAAGSGVGNDTVGGQINLPVSKVITDRWTVHGNLGGTFLPDVKGNDLTGINMGVSAIYAITRDLNLMVESVGNFNELGSHRTSSVLVSPGFRFAWNFPDDAQIVVGAAAPIGLTHDAPDWGVFLYFSFEHRFRRAPGKL